MLLCALLKLEVRECVRSGVIGFKNRTHTEEAKKKIAEANTGRKFSHTEETKKRISDSLKGEKNPFFGKTHSEYSKKLISDANKGNFYMTKEQLQKRSIKFTGKGNPMYGKCPEKGSKGIGGWLNGLHFRSTCELYFLIHNNCKDWISAATKEFRIVYKDDNGISRFYFPDFFCDGILVEIKPINWQKSLFISKNIEHKQKAALEFCEKMGWEYKFLELPGIDKKHVFKMRKLETISLDKKWEAQYQNWITKV